MFPERLSGLSSSDIHLYYNLRCTNYPIYLNKITTWMNHSREYTGKDQGVISYLKNVEQIIHYLGRVDSYRFEVIETRLIVYQFYVLPKGSYTDDPRTELEFAEMQHAELKHEVGIFHEQMGQGKSYYFYKEEQKPKHFHGNTSTHFVLNFNLRANPFKNNSDITKIEDAMRSLCFQVINFIASEPIKNRTKFREDITNFKTKSIEVRHGYYYRDKYNIYDTYISIMGKSEYVFTTTEGVTQMLNLKLFTRPFDKDSWLLILVFGLILIPGGILILVDIEKMTSVDTFLKLIVQSYTTLLDAAPDAPPILIKILLESKFKYRIIIGLWLLMCIILTNGYKGIVVSDLTAP